MAQITIDDLSGGMADDHAAVLEQNQVVAAYDVDFWRSAVGGRRNGSSNLVTGLTSPVFLARHTPTSSASADLLFSASIAGVWTTYNTANVGTIRTPSYADTFTPAEGFDGASLHGKFFLACRNSGVSRMHVWDGTNLRRASLPSNVAAPTAADTAGAGAYANIRYFRIRWATQDTGVTILRSEPSAVLTKTPSGVNVGLTITRPGLPGEAETHWEVEESIDNANFYRIATVLAATTTYADTLASTAVATSGTLSEAIGSYLPLPSARWLAVDNDRLVMGGNFENTSLDARVQWTPLRGATGVGNDERIPLSASNYIDCDNGVGGGLTGLKAYEGKIVAFKLGQVHVLARSGANGTAYLPAYVVRSKGALPNSVVEGFDRDGRAVLYFLDPASGPSVMGVTGIINLTPQMRRTWIANINRSASVRVCNAVYYADRQQVWWHIATGANTAPNQRWVFHTESGGVTIHTLPNIGAAYSAVMWDSGTGNRPHVGSATSIAMFDDPTATSDAGTGYRAYIRTRAYTLKELLHKGGVVSGVVEAEVSTGTTLTLKLIRDYGAETTTVTASLTASGTETIVIVPVDDAFISEAKVIQFEIGDAGIVAAPAWQLFRMVFRLRPEGRT